MTEGPPTGPDEPSAESEERIPGFAPSDPTDNRKPYDGKSKWQPEHQKAQWVECAYLAVLLVLGIAGLATLLLCTDVASPPSGDSSNGPTPPKIIDFRVSMGLVFCTGLLGGVTFTFKWWYHSIARGIWHLDRRQWRFVVPWQSAVVATMVHTLFKSDLIGLLNPASLDRLQNVIAFGFLVGYFSDTAVAKLAEVAESLFGARGSRKQR